MLLPSVYSENRISRDDSSHRPSVVHPIHLLSSSVWQSPSFPILQPYWALVFLTKLISLPPQTLCMPPEIFSPHSILSGSFLLIFQNSGQIFPLRRRRGILLFIHFMAPCRRKSGMGMSTLPAFNSSNLEWNCFW